MTERDKNEDLTSEELEIVEHAKALKIHLKKAGRHSGHAWYCFDCPGNTTDHIAGAEAAHKTDHKSFDSNAAIRKHLVEVHHSQWT